jgi:hypothetical protein
VSLADSVKNLLPFLRGPLRLPPDLLRGLHPARNPAAQWTREGEENLVVISMPRPPTQGWKMAVAKFVGEAPGKRIELSDELGSDVWELCDGAHTVRDICRELSSKYKLGDRQTEVAVLQFLNMLRTRRLLGIPEREQGAIDRATGKAKASAATTSDLGKASDGDRNDKPRRSRPKGSRRY